MVNAILRRLAIIIKSLIAKIYGSFMAQVAQAELKMPKRLASRLDLCEAATDAEFETIDPSSMGGLADGVSNDSGPEKFEPKKLEAKNSEHGQTDSDKTGMSVFGKKSSRPAPDDSIAFYGFGAVLVVLSFWVFGGHSLFQNVDRMTTASIRAVSTEIADASWRVVTADGKTELFVEGIVKNSGKVALHTKPVTVTVKHNGGSTKRYLLGQNGWTLAPGQEVVVSGRLDIGSASIASVVIALSN
jgi:archaellum component FlaG (FlaF/FlaG flagellin family)